MILERREGRIALLVFAIVLLCGSALVGHVRQADIELDRTRASGMATDYAGAVSATLDRAFASALALGAFVGHDLLDLHDFPDFAEKLLLLHEGVAALAIAPGGVVLDIYPRGENMAAIGHDLLNDPQRNEGSARAIATGKLILAGPYPLVQGGVGAVGRFPVFIPDARGDRQFWGFTTAVLRFPDALAAARLEQLEGRGYRYRLWRTVPASGQPQIIAESTGWTHSALVPVEVPVTVPGGEWTLSIVSLDGWGNSYVPLTGGLLVLLTAALLAFLTHALLLQRAQKQTLEDTVNQRTADLKQAQAVARLGSWVIDFRTGRVEWSDETRRILGVSGDVAAGFDAYLACVHPDDRERVIAARDEAMAGGVYDVENRVLVDGRSRWVHSVASITRDAQGNPLRAVGTMQDITGQKLHESQMLEAVTVFKHSMHGIAIADAQGVMSAINPAFSRITGYDPQDVIGRRAVFFEREPLNASWFDTLWEAVGRSGTWEGEIVGRRKSGELYPQSISISAVRDAQGRVVKYVALFSDMTRHKQQQSKMLAVSIISAQEREQARIAHELHDNFGQVLTALNLSLANGQNQASDAALKSVFRQSQALVGRLIEEVRMLAYRLRPAELDALGLAAALRSLVEQVKEQSQLDIRFEENIGWERFPHAIEICCFRVTQEALTNCIRHARATQVRVRLVLSWGELMLVVGDDGCGFDALSQLLPAATGSMGLLGMRERAENAGGQVHIDSAPGQGTVITLKFALPD